MKKILSKKQMATARAMAVKNHSFHSIAEHLDVSMAKLYRAFPGGLRVLKGQDPYAPRTAPTKRKAAAKKIAKKPAKKAAKKVARRAGKKVDW